jgi:class 3 adenylate cyclase
LSQVLVESTLDLQSPPGELWAACTDTEYLNRVSGRNALELQRVENGAARVRVRTRAGGFRVEWDEYPFEWTAGRAFRVRRRMLKGPVGAFETGFRLEPSESGGTRLTLRIEMEAKSALMKPIIRLGAKKEMEKLAASVKQLDAALVAKKPWPAPRSPINDAALNRATTAMRGQVAPELIERLLWLVREERDDAMGRIRPYEWADRWGLDRRAVLAAFLSGVRAGLFELRWEMICPSCQNPSDRVPTLSGLADHGTCHMCDLAFGLELDEAVEATFLPAAAVRKIDTGQYCVGGPARMPHVLAQAIVSPGGVAELTVPDEPGRYRVFVRGGATQPVQVEAGLPARVEVRDDASDLVRVAPGGVIAVRSTVKEERHVKLERTQYKQQAASARDVTALPGFRRDFSADVLRPDVSLRVSHVTLFFSDLTGSTQLYSNVGDAPALKLVQDHFDVVVKLIEQHDGTLVKTIGDAVMAAFVDEQKAFDASLAILRAFEEFRRGHPDRTQTHIKLGLYAGPSYLVTANNVLDYFGQTVNIAARLQAQADSGELVVKAALADEAIERGDLPATAVAQRYAAELKGVNQSIDVARIKIA